MKSCDYVECELPKLPTRVHYAIKALIKDMLWRDPAKVLSALRVFFFVVEFWDFWARR